jgi:hypothetical protein
MLHNIHIIAGAIYPGISRTARDFVPSPLIPILRLASRQDPADRALRGMTALTTMAG